MKRNFQELESTIHAQRSHYTALLLPPETVTLVPAEFGKLQEALDQFNFWLNEVEEVAHGPKPLSADLLSLKEEQIANKVATIKSVGSCVV